jgi:hypothetical protein
MASKQAPATNPFVLIAEPPKQVPFARGDVVPFPALRLRNHADLTHVFRKLSLGLLNIGLENVPDVPEPFV